MDGKPGEATEATHRSKASDETRPGLHTMPPLECVSFPTLNLIPHRTSCILPNLGHAHDPHYTVLTVTGCQGISVAMGQRRPLGAYSPRLRVRTSGTFSAHLLICPSGTLNPLAAPFPPRFYDVLHFAEPKSRHPLGAIWPGPEPLNPPNPGYSMYENRVLEPGRQYYDNPYLSLPLRLPGDHV